jgi:hypothetical protein
MECLPFLVEYQAPDERAGPLYKQVSPGVKPRGRMARSISSYFSASAPDTISISSLVITAWRVRL